MNSIKRSGTVWHAAIDRRLGKHKQLTIIAILIIAGFASYANVYGNQFLWDDEFLIENNRFIRDFSHLPEVFASGSGAGAGRIDNLYRPMQLAAYTLVYYMAGPSPWAFHLLNVLLHACNAVLLFFLVKGVSRKESLAFLASLLWVVHPIHTEAITYMSGTADPLSVFFALASFILYIRFREQGKPVLLAGSCVLFILALFTKEIVIILPLLLVLYEFVSRRGNGWRRYQWIIPLLAIAAVYFSLRLTVLDFGGTLNFYSASNIYTENLHVRVFTFLASLLTYYSTLFFPVNLHIERDFPLFTSVFSTEVLLSIAILGLFAFIAWKNIKKNRLITFGILWFFLSLLPMSGIIPVNSLVLEHWMYLASMGFFLLAALLIHRAWEKNRRIAVLVLLMVISLSTLTLARNTDWKDPVTLYSNILQYGEGSSRVHNNLAMAYADRDELASAEYHYLKAIEISDTHAETHYNLARLYAGTGRMDSAIAHLERSIGINPDFFFSYNLLGEIYQALGENELAAEFFGKAASIDYY